jgi:hypothetical protein
MEAWELDELEGKELTYFKALSKHLSGAKDEISKHLSG